MKHTKANEFSWARACQHTHTLSSVKKVTLHDVKDAQFDGLSQLVDTGLLLGHRFSVTSCQFKAGPDDYSVLPYKPQWETKAEFSCINCCTESEMPFERDC